MGHPLSHFYKYQMLFTEKMGVIGIMTCVLIVMDFVQLGKNKLFSALFPVVISRHNLSI